MSSITAIEIGADTCALAITTVRQGTVRVSAAETLDPTAFPGVDAFAVGLQQARRVLKLPRRCRAVVWGLPDGATPGDMRVAPLVEPLTRAGFRVARVVTPCNALGALSRLRVSRAGGAMCWLGINRNGVAVVVIRPGKLLYSHSFAWDSNVGAIGSQARLLQRYSLVSFLAPEVRRAVAAAKQKGTTVDGVITCGNLPDLRALTMPLIEELDLEVETLDSLEGLEMTPELAEKLSEMAPAIRLACAGAFARETRTADEAIRRRVRRMTRLTAAVAVGALVVLGVGGAYAWYALTHPPKSANPVVPPVTAPARSQQNRLPGGDPKAPLQAAPPTKAGSNVMSTVPAPTQPPPAQVPPRAQPAVPTQPAAGTHAASSVPVPARPPASPAQAAGKPENASHRPGTLNPTAAPADKPDATVAGRAGARPLPELLKDPVPRVTAILVSAERRLATIGDQGQIIAVGDTIGRRVVVGIDDRTVLLREPSGVQIRVALGGRVVGVERSDR